MTVNGLSEAVQKARGGTMGWGLGNVQVLLTTTAGDPANKGEYGWDGTAGTIFWIDPAKETVIVLMTPSQPSNPDQIRQRFKAIIQQAVVD
jgi:CubicO group peptidase (beta-lactamase class C family)